MSKTINKLNAISVILMALLTHDATAASSYAEDQSQSMSGRAAMRGGSVASNNAQAATENRATNTQSQSAQQAQSDQAPALNNNNSNLIQGLIKQANFWHDKQQHDRAMQSLQRVLISDPHNEECLYLMSLWSFEVKDNENAKLYRDKLYKLSPGSTYILQLDNQRNMQSLSSDQLNHARALASSGNVTAALVEYQKLFTGVMPPKELVSEYYLTMSGDPNYYQRALTGLVNYIKTNANDVNAQITYGKILSYRQSTIRKGISVLAYYAPKSQDADKALRQALLWLDPEQNDEKYYSDYASRHPNDSEVKAHYDSTIIGGMTKKAYDKSASDKLDAIHDFEKILAKNPNNQDALEAIGYLHLELKNYVKAHEYLAKAASLGGSKKDKLDHDANLAAASSYEATGNYKEALAQLDSILQKNAYDVDALLTKADILKKQGNVAQAELALTTVLAADSTNAGANEMLYYLYRDSGKSEKAKGLLATMPVSLADKIRNATASKAYVDPIPPIRESAQRKASTGDVSGAIETLQQGLNKYPKASWLHYDLGRLLKQQGYEAGASSQISYLTRDNANDEDLLAAASLLSEFKQYSQADNAVSRIRKDTPQVKALKEELAINRTFSQVELYEKAGNSQAALNTLRMMNLNEASLSNTQLSHLAFLYLKAGDPNKALSLADTVAARPMDLDASISDYADLITVYNQTGNEDKARMFSENQQLLANSNYSDIEKIATGDAVRKADALRNLNRYADAYDVIYPLISKDPENPALRMAMARIYQDNGMYNESYKLYEQVLSVNADNQEALQGAINASLANEDYDTATVLAMKLQNTDDPKVLTLLARIDNKNKDYRDALEKLNRARALIDSRYDYASANNVEDPDLSVASTSRAPNNPFANKSNSSEIMKTKVILPWENKKANSSYSYNMSPTEKRNSLNEINFMIRDLKDKVATTASVSVEGRQKDGEDGMSKLQGISVPVTVSTPVLGGLKLDLTARMDSFSAGTVLPSSSNEFGTNALNVGVQNLVTRINALKESYSKLTDAGNINAFMVQNGLDKIKDQADVAKLLQGRLLNAADFSLQSAQGRQRLMQYFAQFKDVRAVMKAVNNLQSANAVMADAKAKRKTGVGFAAALSDDNYKLDFGITPVGKEGTTVVGGTYFKIPLSAYSELRFKGERRAMTDSLLSYFGYEDRMSGTYWGGVTKNGGSIEYAYDDGFVGASLETNAYRYLGKNVLSNSSYGLKSTLYVHPFKTTMYEDMTVGLSLSYDNYSHNENHFTLGHGGYFSPQNYYIASIPFTYMKRTDDLKFTANIALGYQSYKENEEDYFPTNKQYQSDLNMLKDFGLAPYSRFPSKSESGIGGSAKLNLDYYLLDDLVVGGSLNYNTFGDYNEMYEMLYIKSVLGGH